MANPFFVQPAQYGQSLQQAADAVDQFAQKQYMDEAKQAMASAFQSQDPMAIRDAVMRYPEIAETATQMFGFTNDQTEQVARETYRRVLSETDPQRRAAIMEGGIETVSQFGGNPRMMSQDLRLLRENPEAFDRSAKAGFASIASDAEFEALFPDASRTTDPSAVREFEYFRGLTPEQQEQYQAVKRGTKTVNIGGVEYLPMADGTLKPMTIETREGSQEVTPETTAASKATISAAEEQAKQDVKSRSPEQVRKQDEAIQSSRMNIANTQDVVRQVDDILNNESFINSISGIRGRLPAAPGTQGFDADVAFDRLKNTLTLGNLDKMSGVLSESDIKILQSAAGGLEAGMSEESLKRRLNEIRKVFQSKTQQEREKLSQMIGNSDEESGAGGMSDADADALIDSILGQ